MKQNYATNYLPVKIGKGSGVSKTSGLLALAILLTLCLAVNSAQADAVFFFTPGNTGATTNDVSGYIFATAAETAAKDGVEFTFTSTWTGGSNNNGRGWLQNNGSENIGSLYIWGGSDVFTTSQWVVAGSVQNTLDKPFGGSYFQVASDFVVQIPNANVWSEEGYKFSMFYGADGNWNAFVDAVLDGFAMGVHLGDLGGASGAYIGLGFVLDPIPLPEPATLAVLGLGLAGLGIARRKMKK